MRSRHTIPVLFALLAIPAVASAGPIQFDLVPTNLYVAPGSPAIAGALELQLSPGPTHTFDLADGVPARVGVVQYNPSRLGQPAPIDIHPDGTTHWNNDGYFRVDMRLTDSASGAYADFSLWGRAHMYNQYADGQWGGTTYFWFGNWGNARSFTLGGNEYSLWGQERYTDEQPAVSVWVGPDSPGPHAPEPGTLLLAALGLAPLALRAWRGKKQH
jgi:hypothetical protein